jgi:hypothetical protein
VNFITKKYKMPKNKKITGKECKWYAVCPMKRYYEAGKLDSKWVELYCLGDWNKCVRYRMEEAGKPHPDWMLPDGTLSDILRDD